MRPGAVLPLVTSTLIPDDWVMFAVYCEDHGSQVLLSTDHIIDISNHDHGIDVRWRCNQGHEGVWHASRPRRPSPAQFHAAA